MADVAAALNEAFRSSDTALPADVVAELLAILRLYDLSPQDLFFKWESYSLKMSAENTRLDYQTVRDFKKDLQDALERESRTKSAVKKGGVGATPRASASGNVYGMLDGLVSTTPAARSANGSKRKNASFETPSAKATKTGASSSPGDFKTPVAPSSEASTTSFADRANAGQIIETLNAQIELTPAPATPPSEARVKLKAYSEISKFAYKTMNMKLSEASEILDDRIDSFLELIQQHYQLSDSAFGNPAAMATEEIVAVGRIVSDTQSGKLNAASLLLETSRRTGAGMRVPLRVADGVSYDFFPGKIVALKGTNVSGECFSATEVLQTPLLPLPASTPNELDVQAARLEDEEGEKRPLNLMVASGPYTTDQDLDYAPLKALLEKARETVADVLILIGPFLDLEHPLVASGDLEQWLPSDAKIEPDQATLTDVFRVLIAQPIAKLCQQLPGLTVIIVPSVRDAVNKHVSWPQDRLPRTHLGLPKQCQVATNPVTVSINEVVVGISSLDVLSELRAQSVAKGNGLQADLMARLSAQVIDQRHFFPVYPPQAREQMPRPAKTTQEPDHGVEPVESLAVGASLDLTYLKLGEWLNVLPDVLITPSVLLPFAKVVESVLVLNPGTLSKRRGAGTFCRMTLQPRTLTAEEREADAAVAHDVFARARVDVTRI